MDKIQELIKSYQWLVGVLALVGLEIAPIKFSPISLLGKALGKFLGIDSLANKIDCLEKKVDANELDRIRYEILQFSYSLREGAKREEVEYRHIEDIYKKYRDKGANSFIVSEMQFIRDYRNESNKIHKTML